MKEYNWNAVQFKTKVWVPLALWFQFWISFHKSHFDIFFANYSKIFSQGRFLPRFCAVFETVPVSPGRAVLWCGHETRWSSVAVSADLRDSAGGSNRELRDLAETGENQPCGGIFTDYHGIWSHESHGESMGLWVKQCHKHHELLWYIYI